MRAFLAVAFAVLASFVAASAGRAQETPAPAAPTPDAFYGAAVESMRALPQPQYLTYTMEGEGDGLAIGLKVIHHLVWLNMETGGGPSYPTSWSLRHRTEDYASEIVEESGRRLVSSRAFFDPTWYGAFHALRDGMLMYQKPEAPASSFATPTPGPSPDLRTIAVVEVLGSKIYRVEDRGTAQCPNGDPGHALHLVSRDRNPRHQLADVTVDLQNHHFCSMRFNVREFGFDGSVEQHYADVRGYWLQTDGWIESATRALGIMVGHGVWRYRLENMTFPNDLPQEAFVPPYYQ